MASSAEAFRGWIRSPDQGWQWLVCACDEATCRGLLVQELLDRPRPVCETRVLPRDCWPDDGRPPMGRGGSLLDSLLDRWPYLLVHIPGRDLPEFERWFADFAAWMRTVVGRVDDAETMNRYLMRACDDWRASYVTVRRVLEAWVQAGAPPGSWVRGEEQLGLLREWTELPRTRGDAR